MLVTSQCVELMRRPALSVWRTPVAMSAWKHDSTGRSTSWLAQDSGPWHGSLPYENRPPRQEMGDGPRLRRPQRLFLRVRVCIAMLWCARRDSNPHARRHQNLNLGRLPIPPLAPWPQPTCSRSSCPMLASQPSFPTLQCAGRPLAEAATAGGMTWRLLEAAKRPPMPPRTLPRPAGRVVGERGLRQPEPAARPGRARERARYVRAMRPSPGSSTRHELRSAPAPRPRGGRARSCDSASSSCSPCVFTARIWALRGRAECRYLLRPGDGWLMGSRHGAADVTSRHPVVGRSARNRCGPYDRRRGERSRWWEYSRRTDRRHDESTGSHASGEPFRPCTSQAHRTAMGTTSPCVVPPQGLEPWTP